jgi:alpha-glucosidase
MDKNQNLKIEIENLNQNLEIEQKNKDNYIWWKNGVIYQIYPRSFKDSNGDGVGDIRGIIEKLDYLVDLGVDAIWLTPFFVSPMVDFGYDVSDYRSVDPIFGTNQDLDELIAKAHQNGIKIILDLVLNHSSNQHPWFVESRSYKTSPKRDYYIWKSPKEGTITKENPRGEPPNNWLSVFNGSAWTYDEQTEEYYFHSFLPEQPDFNWRNPELEKELLGIISYWLEKGVDGFRLDALNSYLEDNCLRDNPLNNEDLDPHSFVSQSPVYTTNQKGIHELLQKFRKLTDDWTAKTGKQIMLLGEIGAQTDAKNTAPYYGENNDELNLTSNFDFTYAPFDPQELRARVEEWEKYLPDFAFPHYTFGNHDIKRMVSRHSKGLDIENRMKRVKLACVFLLTIRGTPIIYYGEEIGMEELEDLTKDQIRDPFGLRNYPEIKGRDGCRTPMQWNDQNLAGFTEANESWLPINPNYKEINVDLQKQDPNSVLNTYKKTLALRKKELVLQIGRIEFIEVGNSKCLGYIRELEQEVILVLLNFESGDQTINLSRDLIKNYTLGEILLVENFSKELVLSDDLKHQIALEGYQAVVVRLVKNN